MAALAVASSAPNAFAQPDANEEQWKSVANEIRQVAERLRDAIVRKDIAGILKFVGKSGLRCGDDAFSRRRVEEMLRTPGSWLHDELFDSEALRNQGREGAISIRDFFIKAEGLEVDVGLYPFSLRKDLEFPCMVFRARNSTDDRGFCFFREGKRWVLSDFSGC